MKYYQRVYHYIITHPDLTDEEKVISGFNIMAQALGWSQNEAKKCIIDSSTPSDISDLIIKSINLVKDYKKDTYNLEEVLTFLRGYVQEMET